MTKGLPIFEWISGSPITDQADNKHKTEDNEIASTYGNDDDDDITKNGEKEESIEEKAYAKEEQDDYLQDR